ncbi:MAG: hypothetical protein Kow00109_23400 [Acidobacteriota bacterium]
MSKMREVATWTPAVRREGAAGDVEILSIDPAAVLPDRDAVLRELAIANEERLSNEAAALLDAALEEASRLATAIPAVLRPIANRDLDDLFRPPELHQHPSPLEQVFDGAGDLAAYAATLGAPICSRIREHFAAGDYPRGFYLDTIASLMADAAGDLLEHYFEWLLRKAGGGEETAALGYSPGYCGWRLEAQRPLFRVLGPERIGLHLNESFLMDPIKSISGILAAGPPEIHFFRNDYDFCADCRTQSCLRRMRALQRRFPEARRN